MRENEPGHEKEGSAFLTILLFPFRLAFAILGFTCEVVAGTTCFIIAVAVACFFWDDLRQWAILALDWMRFMLTRIG